MPHLRLEYSANIREKIDPEELFSPCHHILVATVNAQLFRCQSRAICRDTFHIGDGSSSEAFIYLEISLIEGRSPSQLQEAGQKFLKVLEGYFSQSIRDLNVQMGVRLLEFPVSHYFKFESER